AAFSSMLSTFALSGVIGYQVVWGVAHSLHSPLMAVTNAISGIIVIGALVQISSPSNLVVILAGISVLIATINIAGGFLVTQRMLRMFRKS
ncbi:MAG: proton-translocating transhydrogenase family protein, partial [Candidatus Puniceispirillaceae bacterium]